MNTAISQAITAAGGSQTKLARLLGVKPQTVQYWTRTGKVPVERALQIETALHGVVTRETLRPDIFQLAPSQYPHVTNNDVRCENSDQRSSEVVA